MGKPEEGTSKKEEQQQPQQPKKEKVKRVRKPMWYCRVCRKHFKSVSKLKRHLKTEEHRAQIELYRTVDPGRDECNPEFLERFLDMIRRHYPAAADV